MSDDASSATVATFFSQVTPHPYFLAPNYSMASELNDDDLVDYDEDEGVDDAKPAGDAKK